MVVQNNGRTIGTVGGGNLAHKMTIEAVQCIGLGKSKEVSYDLQSNTEPGMSWGGPGITQTKERFLRTFQILN